MRKSNALVAALALLNTPEAQRNPFAGDAAAVTGGKALIDRACQSCHGPNLADLKQAVLDGRQNGPVRSL